MKQRRLQVAISLAIVAASYANFVMTPQVVPAGQALAATSKKSSKAKSSKAAKSDQWKTFGVDAQTYAAWRVGNLQDVMAHLEQITASDTTVGTNEAWLAFAYLFLGKCDQLKTLTTKTHGQSETSGSNAKNIVAVLDLTCQQKWDEAKKLALTLPQDSTDPITNLALAAVAAKTSNFPEAIARTERILIVDPDFAWGYRVIGFIEEKNLKHPDKAEVYYLKALEVEPSFKEVQDLLVDVRLLRNDFDGAIDIAEAAIKSNPKEANNQYRLAQIYLQQWRLREALDQLQKASIISRDNPRYFRTRASIFRHQKKLKEAIAEQQKAVDLSKEKAFELVELASLQAQDGQTGASILSLQEALKLAPSNNVAHQRLIALLLQGKRDSDLVEEYRRAISVQPKQAGLRVGLAQALRRLGTTDQAIAELKEAANLDSTDPRAHRELGAIFIEQKDFSAAAKAFTRALNINPSSVEDLVALGYTYAQTEDYVQAETALVTALALQQLTGSQSNRLDVMRALGALLLTEGRYAEAFLNLDVVAASERDAAKQPQDKFVMLQAKALRDRTATSTKELTDFFDAQSAGEKNKMRIAYAETSIKVGKIDAAIAALNDASEASKGELQWLTTHARALRLKGDAAKAFDTAKKATEIKDEAERQSDAYSEYTLALLALGKADEALTAANKAVELNPKSFIALEAQSRVFLKKNELEKSGNAAKMAIEVNPYHVPAYLIIGDVYLTAGQNPEAAVNYKRAAELYPSSLEAHRALLNVYKKLAQNDEVKKEEEIIAAIEKRS
jgi:tetratricopeptide (TPR) repeat protein